MTEYKFRENLKSLQNKKYIEIEGKDDLQDMFSLKLN